MVMVWDRSDGHGGDKCDCRGGDTGVGGGGYKGWGWWGQGMGMAGPWVVGMVWKGQWEHWGQG